MCLSNFTIDVELLVEWCNQSQHGQTTKASVRPPQPLQDPLNDAAPATPSRRGRNPAQPHTTCAASSALRSSSRRRPPCTIQHQSSQNMLPRLSKRAPVDSAAARAPPNFARYWAPHMNTALLQVSPGPMLSVFEVCASPGAFAHTWHAGYGLARFSACHGSVHAKTVRFGEQGGHACGVQAGQVAGQCTQQSRSTVTFLEVLSHPFYGSSHNRKELCTISLFSQYISRKILRLHDDLDRVLLGWQDGATKVDMIKQQKHLHGLRNLCRLL